MLANGWGWCAAAEDSIKSAFSSAGGTRPTELGFQANRHGEHMHENRNMKTARYYATPFHKLVLTERFDFDEIDYQTELIPTTASSDVPKYTCWFLTT